MKRLVPLLIAILACSAPRALAQSNLIIPGSSIGRWDLRGTFPELRTQLQPLSTIRSVRVGSAEFTVASVGSEGCAIVFGPQPDGAFGVTSIITINPAFVVAMSGLHVGSFLEEIQRLYGERRITVLSASSVSSGLSSNVRLIQYPDLGIALLREQQRWENYVYRRHPAQRLQSVAAKRNRRDRGSSRRFPHPSTEIKFLQLQPLSFGNRRRNCLSIAIGAATSL